MKNITVLMGCLLFMLIVNSGCSKLTYNMYATIYGFVTDHETGEPIANANVGLAPGGINKTTGADGMFEFQELDPVQYTITVQKTGYSTNRKSVVAVVDEKTEANIPLTKNN